MRRLSYYWCGCVYVTVGVLFMITGSIKIENPQLFAEQIYQIGIFPWWSVAPLAMLVPWIEVCAALALVLPMLRRSALCVVMMLLLSFICLIILVLAFDIDASCGCFGATSQNIGWGLLIADTLLALSCFSVLVHQRYMNTDSARA